MKVACVVNIKKTNTSENTNIPGHIRIWVKHKDGTMKINVCLIVTLAMSFHVR